MLVNTHKNYWVGKVEALLEEMQPWDQQDLLLAKTLVFAQEARGIPIRVRRVQEFNRYKHPGTYRVAQDSWKKVLAMPGVQAPTTQQLPNYSWELGEDAAFTIHTIMRKKKVPYHKAFEMWGVGAKKGPKNAKEIKGLTKPSESYT